MSLLVKIFRIFQRFSLDCHTATEDKKVIHDYVKPQIEKNNGENGFHVAPLPIGGKRKKRKKGKVKSSEI